MTPSHQIIEISIHAWEGIRKELKIKRKIYVSSRDVRIVCPRLKRRVCLANYPWSYNVISSHSNALTMKLSESCLVRSQRKLISVSPRGDSMCVPNYSVGHFSTIRLALWAPNFLKSGSHTEASYGHV
jgi:hypothetical protein